MKHKSIRHAVWMVAVLGGLVFSAASARAAVITEGDRTDLVDRTGERWDISQAVSTGFDPQRFEFGIGRHAFQTLDSRHWRSQTERAAPGMRVIGVAGNEEAHAYSVGKLRYHETANTRLGSQAIVAGY